MRVKFTTTLDDDIVKKAKIEAIIRGISVAEFLEELLNKYFSLKKNNDE